MRYISYEVMFLHVCTTACDRVCQNGGTLNSSSCMCNCDDIFSGDQCESELHVMIQVTFCFTVYTLFRTNSHTLCTIIHYLWGIIGVNK